MERPRWKSMPAVSCESKCNRCTQIRQGSPSVSRMLMAGIFTQRHEKLVVPLPTQIPLGSRFAYWHVGATWLRASAAQGASGPESRLRDWRKMPQAVPAPAGLHAAHPTCRDGVLLKWFWLIQAVLHAIGVQRACTSSSHDCSLARDKTSGGPCPFGSCM